MAKTEIRLFGDVNIFVRTLPEIQRANLHLGPSLIQRVLGHCAGGHPAERVVSKPPQVVRQFRQIVPGNLVVRDGVGPVHFHVFPIVEARDRDRHWCYPVGHGKAGFRVLLFELADADQNIRGRNLEREVVQRLFPEAVQVRVPRLARSNVIASAARVVQHFVPAVFHGDRVGLSHWWGFVENRVEGAVFLSVFLNEMQVLPVLAGYARHPQRGKQPEFHHAFACDQRLIGDRRAARQVIIFPDDCFDVVPPGGKQPPVLLRTCGAGCQLRFQVLRIPDAVVHSPAVAIDQRHFFGRIELRKGAHTGAHEKSQVLVR